MDHAEVLLHVLLLGGRQTRKTAVTRAVHGDWRTVLVADALIEPILIDGGQIDHTEVEHHATVVLGELHDEAAEPLAAVALVDHHRLYEAGLLLALDGTQFAVGQDLVEAVSGQHQAAGQRIAGGLQRAHPGRLAARPLGVDELAGLLHQLGIVVDGHHIERTAGHINGR